MLDSGGGGGSFGSTNWSASNVRQLWELVKDQQTDGHWKVVTGWSKSAELTSVHLSRVRQYRDNLALAWPPTQSPAAQAYIARLDQLIANLSETHEAAVANHRALAGATGALQTSRAELQKLYEQYVANEDRIQQYEQAKAASATPSSAPTPSPSPRPSPVPSTPPVSAAEQERLNWAARSVMYKLSGTLVEARVQIRTPTPYKPPEGIIDEKRPTGLGEGGAIPVIPPIVVLPPDDHSTGYSARPGAAPTGAPTAGGAHVSVPTPGPTLVGTTPIIAPPTPPAPPPVHAPGPVPPHINTGVIGLPPPPPQPRPKPGMGPSNGIVSAPGAPASPLTGPTGVKPGAGGPGGGPVAGLPRPMPPGGVIGPLPGTGAGHGGTPAQRVNPVGGLIGGGAGPYGGAQAGARGVPPGQSMIAGHQMGAVTGRTAPGRQRDGEPAKTWDPDNPWETDEGVDPVVRPPRDAGRIDPGPAIGLRR